MANAAVDKLKAFGLRQGEKFVVGIAATVLVVSLGVLVTSQTIALTPDQLQKKAESAESHLRQKQDTAEIVSKVEAAGVVDPGFVKMVDNQAANALKPADYRARLDWVTPEPGAGLIRDQPDMIAPTELMAFPGRGGALLYMVDDKGNKIPDTTKGTNGSAPAVAKKEEPKNVPKANRTLAGSVADAKADSAKDAAAPDAPTEPEGPFKEHTTGKRWVVVTGIVDNDLLNKNWLAALKNPAIAFPQYVRIDAERQARQADGTWSEWIALNEDDKWKVLDLMPEVDEELVPLAARPEALVDPLPFLRAGYWTGVHVARLVPSELRNAASPDDLPNMVRGAGSRRGGGGRPGSSQSQMQGQGMGMGMAGESMGGAMSSRSGGARSAMMGGQEGGGSSGGGPEEAVVANTESTIMLRWLDFTVEPNTSYRYRVRLVVKNPNFERSDVNPGTDTSNASLIGPWSDPTGVVSVPANVSIYAQNPGQDTRRDDVVSFLVYCWDPDKGETVVKTDDAAPGFLVGENGSVLYPSAEGTGAENKTIDFNSRSFVLDAIGGKVTIPDIGVDKIKFDVPAVAMVVEADGGVVIKNQSLDRPNEVRKDMDANYRQALSDSGKKREPSKSNRSSGSSMSGGGIR